MTKEWDLSYFYRKKKIIKKMIRPRKAVKIELERMSIMTNNEGSIMRKAQLQ